MRTVKITKVEIFSPYDMNYGHLAFKIIFMSIYIYIYIPESQHFSCAPFYHDQSGAAHVEAPELQFLYYLLLMNFMRKSIISYIKEFVFIKLII